MRIINFKINENDAGLQIRDYLRNFGVSAALLTKLKQTENGITKNGVFAKAIETIESGDELSIKIESKGSMPAPANLPLEIIYEDEDVLALNKPPAMPVHKAAITGATLFQMRLQIICKAKTKPPFVLFSDSTGTQAE